MTTITFEDDALLKLLLHASRHTATPVCGVCLGKRSQGSIRMVDTVPLFHSHSVLGPLAQTALIQVQHYAQTKELSLVAFYEAEPDGSSTGSTVSMVAQQVGDRLSQKAGSDCPVLAMDNVKFGELMSGSDVVPLRAFARGPNGKWSHGNANVESASQDFAARLKRLLAHKAHYKLADFDDHCDQIDRDWRNSDVTEE